MDSKNYHVQSVPRMSEQVARQIIEFISSEKLQKGDKLPSERKLCDLLEVSRSSVREGLRILELLKYLDSKHGGGTFVSEAPPFIIPARLFKQNLSAENLQSYFGVAVTIAEKIIRQFIERHDCEGIVRRFKQNCRDDFWIDFSQLIIQLGKQLKNTYFVSLWDNTYSLLAEHAFFENKKSPFHFEELLIAVENGDEKRLRKLFLSFSI